MKEKIEVILNKFPFVRWDRFVMWGKTLNGGITVSGWIDREDNYKDYICLDIYSDSSVSSPDGKTEGIYTDFMTSSAKYSLPIFKILNEGSGKGHHNCKVIKDYFNVKNHV